ncbi:MAG: type IV toxin-antitoxin system AbiEi family antitoxin domain-containing protein [Acidimicrobiaceae bacterium]|nr:type IV toxin-antitoxin system AbiEi family antitoxin domain-containing protein [Acidimicrobiaceae bacterium]
MRQQHGLIGRSQALESGMTSGQIERRLRTGQWRRAARGVYQHAATDRTRLSRLLAVCLAHDALASHTSAAAIHNIDGYTLERIEVVVAAGRKLSVKGARIHKSTQMDLARSTVRMAIPVTGVARTVLDLAAVVNRERLDDTIDAVVRDGRLRLWDLYQVLVSHARRGRNGCGALRAALDARMGDGGVPLSRWSRMVADLLVESGLGQPRFEYPVHAFGGDFIAQVDLAYPDRRLAIELDSVRWHHNLRSFSHDRQRRNRLLLAGWDVLNFTWDDYSRRPNQLCAAVAAALAPAVPSSTKSVEKHVV